MSNKNEVFEYLIDRLRQQVINNPYKQQCEDLAHEVQSLKNQLRDASVQIKELHLALVKAAGDVEAYKLIRKGGYVNGGRRYVVGEHGLEQSGYQIGEHDWVLDADEDYFVCRRCGETT